MVSNPKEQQLKDALSAAGHAHHEFETNFLKGVRDEQWPGWYAAYVLGRLGDFTTPTKLAAWLAEAPPEGDWVKNAAVFVLAMITAG